MSVRSILRAALGAALLVNAVPHGVSGVQGKPFPSPFGDPPGVGESSPTSNVAWSAVNAIAGAAALRHGIRSRGQAAGAVVGAIGMAAVLAFHFGDVRRGGTGLRRGRSEGSSGPPRALIAATEPIATMLAGRRLFPLWAVLHHTGRKSGTPYSVPVAVVPSSDPGLIVIGLPWGPHTNWARNVVAAGTARIVWKGSEHIVTAPRIVEPAIAAATVKPAFRVIVARMPAAILLQRS
ncbi:nitroreductase family deazaflavin-dependent oxidoreductase [Microbacterium terricola]|uniref:Deazaflavin-dependent oxidoreductase, nitroreductase family n=1 Tax=Microbacterium terricola TaxID=344163 RepID=A0ABM8DZT1_9MICO|nr:nitroreductase family deazaflavin-dependent oxidoreductase [Microbacterium terricola]UYK41183.1 nitroreductase family deazaflavin-dependent oxidoreductase [Microbacterium terricola]BDV31046.1 hypothetical protein Microterr_17060 [Microbacterium terricola]